MSVAWVFRREVHGHDVPCVYDASYPGPIERSGVLGFRSLAKLETMLRGFGFTVRRDWEPRTEPADIAVQHAAASLFAGVYIATLSATKPEYDSARNLIVSPRDVAERAATFAMLDWRARFYPETLPPARDYGDNGPRSDGQ